MHPNTKLYQNRKAKGLCPVCGSERDDEKRSICSKCLAYRRENYQQRLEKQTPAEKKHRSMQKAKAQYARTHRLRQQGLCVQCGAVSPIHWLCEVCYEKRKAWKAKQEG